MLKHLGPKIPGVSDERIPMDVSIQLLNILIDAFRDCDPCGVLDNVLCALDFGADRQNLVPAIAKGVKP